MIRITKAGLNELRNERREIRKEKLMKRHNYKNLKIWNLGIEIVDDVFNISNCFPKEEKFGLISQINRCSVSIPSNIAEGSARTDKSFSHYIDISLGSSFELETQLIIAFKRNYISNEQLKTIEVKIAEFQKMAMSFQNKL